MESRRTYHFIQIIYLNILEVEQREMNTQYTHSPFPNLPTLLPACQAFQLTWFQFFVPFLLLRYFHFVLLAHISQMNINNFRIGL